MLIGEAGMTADRIVVARARRAAVLLVGALALCPGPMVAEAAAEPLAPHGAGGTFPAPLYKLWFKDYAEIDKEVAFSYDAVGSGEGIKRFMAHTVDFAASDAVLTADKAAKVKDGVIQVPATAGMVVLAYNLRGLQDLKLSRAAYAGIFSGTITRWDDPAIAAANPGVTLPARDIALVTRLDASGTTAAFARNLTAVAPAWPGGAGTTVVWPRRSMQAAGNEGVAARIKISEGSIGYVEYGFARRLNLPMAALENRAGQFVAPNAESGQAGLVASGIDPEQLQQAVVDPAAPSAYPIVTYSWLFFYKADSNPQRAGALRSFAQWGLTRGQERAREMGYVPLSTEAAMLGQAALGTQSQ